MAMDPVKPAASGPRPLSPGQAVLLPGAFVVGLVALGLLLRQVEVMGPSILGAGALLGVWTLTLYFVSRRTGRTVVLEVMLFKVH